MIATIIVIVYLVRRNKNAIHLQVLLLAISLKKKLSHSGDIVRTYMCLYCMGRQKAFLRSLHVGVNSAIWSHHFGVAEYAPCLWQ